jgi:protein involved in polysaccharide export with SLBB domain
MKRTFWMFLLGGILLVASASAQTPSPEELELFRNLTPEQQQAVLEGLTSTAVEESDGGRSQRQALGADPEVRRSNDRQVEVPLIPVMKPEDAVLIEATVRRVETEITADHRARLDRTVELIRSRNPYRLDRDARLNLPGFAPIELAGLNEAQATQRLSLEPALLQLEVRLTRLPLEKTGVARLKPYGYDLFDHAPSTFSAGMDAPVPADYVIGPGDRLSVQLFGSSQSRTHRLTVGRDGTISFPDLGPIAVGGLTFSDARARIEGRVEQQMIGMQANVSMGETRAILVYVTGEAKRQGSYAVDGLATMITALFVAGGVNEIGSLRDIQLKRKGEVVRRLDLYDLLISGDTSDNVGLLPGDVIFIPPVGPTVSVDGEVKRPAIYELRGETSVADVVGVAGGLTPSADGSRVSLTHTEGGRRVVVDVNLSSSGPAPMVGNGDALHIARMRPQVDGVELTGFVHRPGAVAWRDGVRLSDVIGSVDELLPNADQGYVLVRRESGPDRRISVHSADLRAALAAPGSDADLPLQRRDRIIVFDLSPGRERIIQPLLEELRLQSELSRPTEIVEVGGRVKVPGKVPLEPGMKVSDLLRAGGGLDPAAYDSEAELTRYTINDAGERRTELIPVNLASLRRGEAGADILLQSDDHLIVRETPDWNERESITIRGEVRLPGQYTIRRGETLWQVLQRAGGLTTLAFPEGSAFTRRDLREIQQRQLDALTDRTRGELASLALQAANAGQASAAEALQTGQALVTQLGGARATGRFIIDLPGLLAGGAGGPRDVLLRDGDELVIPKLRQEVSVIGEVQNATSHLYVPGLKRDDYVSQSGGTTKKADRDLIYVVRADGNAATGKRSLRGRAYNVEIKPGDTIVVPLDTERMPRLPFWQAVTQILYNVAVSVAAVNSF